MADHSATRGADYVFEGIREFYKHKQLWKYAIPSLAITLIADTVAVYLLIKKGLPAAEQLLKQLTGVLPVSFVQPLHYVLLVVIWLTFLLLLSALSFILFESTGCIFFSKMVARYEREILSGSNPPLRFTDELRNMIDSVLYTCGTVILLCLLSVVGFFLPIIAEFLKAYAIGYRYAISYTSEAGFVRHIRLQNITQLIPSGVTASFGVTVYFLLLIPFLGLFLIPGFFIGGAIMADREIA